MVAIGNRGSRQFAAMGNYGNLQSGNLQIVAIFNLGNVGNLGNLGNSEGAEER